MCPAFLSRHTCVHAGEHETQGGHGAVRARHVDALHTELHQRLRIDPRQLLGQKQALQAAQGAVVDHRGRGLLAGGQHHTAQLGTKQTDIKTKQMRETARPKEPIGSWSV